MESSPAHTTRLGSGQPALEPARAFHPRLELQGRSGGCRDEGMDRLASCWPWPAAPRGGRPRRSAPSWCGQGKDGTETRSGRTRARRPAREAGSQSAAAHPEDVGQNRGALRRGDLIFPENLGDLQGIGVSVHAPRRPAIGVTRVDQPLNRGAGERVALRRRRRPRGRAPLRPSPSTAGGTGACTWAPTGP